VASGSSNGCTDNQKRGTVKWGNKTDSVLLFPCQLTRSLEIDSEVGEIAFVVLARILDGVDMERDSEAVNGQYHRLCFAIDEYLEHKLVADRVE
jgi:hypothetical protein